jgi:hypothetical protein
MVCIYLRDNAKTYSQGNPGDSIYAGSTYYNNKCGKTVFIESWSSTSTGINPANNIRNFVVSSTVQIQNLGNLDGTYETVYTFSQDVYDLNKNLVVYYVGVTNKCRIKVTYREAWTKVSVQLA